MSWAVVSASISKVSGHQGGHMIMHKHSLLTWVKGRQRESTWHLSGLVTYGTRDRQGKLEEVDLGPLHNSR